MQSFHAEVTAVHTEIVVERGGMLPGLSVDGWVVVPTRVIGEHVAYDLVLVNRPAPVERPRRADQVVTALYTYTHTRSRRVLSLSSDDCSRSTIRYEMLF